MKTVLTFIAASLLAFAAPASAVKPDLKCCTRCCVGKGQLTPPVETGKSSCKAHPGSCK